MKGFSKSKDFYSSVVLFIYIFCISFIAYHHEAWGDEADSFLMVRDLSLFEIFSMIRYTGNGLTWYLLLYPFVKLGFGFEIQQIIHIFLASFIAFYFLFKSPFNLFINTLIIFSYPFGYEYAIISRCYSLGIIFLLIATNNYFKRNTYPFCFYIPIILAIYTNLYATIIASWLFVFSIYKDYKNKNFNNKNKLYILITIISYFLFIILMYPPSDGQLNDLVIGKKMSIIPNILKDILLSLFCFPSSNPPYFIGILFLLAEVLYIFFVFFYFKSIFKLSNKENFYFSLFTYISLLLFLLIIRSCGTRHSAHLFVTLILSFWLIKKASPKFTLAKNKFYKYFIFFVLPLSVFSTFSYYYLDFKYPFSNSKKIAKNINKLNINNTIYADNLFLTMTSLVYLKNHKNFFYISQNRIGSHMTWDNKYNKALNTKFPQIIKRIKKIINNKQNKQIYFLSTKNIKRFFNKKHYSLRLLASSTKKSFDDKAMDEKFYFYYIKKI